jgi:hypothetical protein
LNDALSAWIAIPANPESSSLANFKLVIENTDPGSNAGVPGIQVPVAVAVRAHSRADSRSPCRSTACDHARVVSSSRIAITVVPADRPSASFLALRTLEAEPIA